jgi:ferritin-like metal-binding protein YciE
VLDAALIAAAQRVEHYEMAGYGTAREFADRLGHMEAVKLLQETLDEEKKADKKLTEIAARGINAKASY